MNIAVLGTGTVGETIATRLVQLGHVVKMGSRTAGNLKAAAWAARQDSPTALHGTIADAAAFGALVFNCTGGAASLQALELAGREHLAGKVLVDLANPLDYSRGMPPALTVCNTDSLGEQIQRAFPEARVVKTLNTVTARVMVDPSLVAGEHDIFVSGDDPDAKAQVTTILKDWFGWRSVVDLGDIRTARGTEMLLPIWLTLRGVLQTPIFNFNIVH